MVWQCSSCEGENSDEDYTCEHCGYVYYDPSFYQYEYNQDVTIKSQPKAVTKRSTCEFCFHKHYHEEYCHVYIESDIPEDGEGSENDFEGSDGAISEKSEESPKKGPKFSSKKKKQEVIEPLETPDFVKKINYERCNCKHGIPSGDLDYIPLPQPFMVGDLKVLTYHFAKAQSNTRTLSVYAQELLHQQLIKQLGQFIPHILSYLPLGQCASTAITCSAWRDGANAYGEYRDMRDSVPWQLYKPHQIKVDSVVIVGQRLFSGGDRRVYVSDMCTGETLHQITRDTGSIPLLLHHDGAIYCCSSNGAIRVFNLMHNVKRIHLDLTMWEHAKRVTSVLFGEKSVGNCDLHGMENHICRMYTASDDRLIRIWDTEIHLPVKTIRTKMMRNNTPQCLAKSSRHLFAGTSGGTVMIFSLHSVCERDDVHNCWSGVEDSQNKTDEIGIVREDKESAIDRSFCLQITLRLPFVQSENEDGNSSCVCTILCSGPNYQQSHLFTGDSSGRLTIWELPQVGLDFQPVKTWRPHKRRLSDMKSTYKHLITIGEDGLIVFHDLVSFNRIRTINFLDWAIHKQLIADGSEGIPRGLTCMSLVENFETGGSLVVGTSYGELSVIGIGTHV